MIIIIGPSLYHNVEYSLSFQLSSQEAVMFMDHINIQKRYIYFTSEFIVCFSNCNIT